MSRDVDGTPTAAGAGPNADTETVPAEARFPAPRLTPGAWWQQPEWAALTPPKPKPLYQAWSGAWNGAAVLVLGGLLIALAILGYFAFFTNAFI
jgi:hypothetical protein